ncbi:MAG: hypothetical protein RLZZ480_473 [Candidatus Parcubacteria bacterium]|jgi:hypothetical protein
MTKNPFYNAAAALCYILCVVGVINLLGHYLGDKPDNKFLAPLFALSLLTLSVSIMGYIFFYQPLVLLTEGKQKLALNLFLKTVAIFASLTFLVFLTMLALTQ